MKKRFYLIITFLLSLNIICGVYGELLGKTGFDDTLPVGELIKSDATLWFGTSAYPVYTLQGESFMALSDLERIGAYVQDEGTHMRLLLKSGVNERVEENASLEFNQATAYISSESFYVGFIRTYSIKAEDECFLPFKVLATLWDIEEDKGYYTLKPKNYENAQYIQIGEGKLTNLSDYTLNITYTQMYWKQDCYIEKIYEDQIITPHESIVTEEELRGKEENMIYLTTFVQEICDIPLQRSEEDYGQKPTALYTAYINAKRLRALEKIFPHYKVTVKLRYPAAGFKEGEEVELWRSEKGQYHVLKRGDGKKIIVPVDSIDIVSDRGKGWQPGSTPQLEDYVNLKNYESDTNYLIWTDVYRQLTYIFKGERGNWNLVKTMKCSTGKNTSLTPSGEFKIEYKFPYFGMDKGYRCKNALVIFRDYMYHSILFDVTGKYVRTGQYQLGQRVSHGCIRLSEEDSAWLYKNIPEHTKVYIE